MELREKMGVILRATHNEKCQHCHMSVCSRFFSSCFSVRYYLNWFTVGKATNKNKKGELFIETQCVSVTLNTEKDRDRQTDTAVG